jgi:tetratricopeptide (TPR) repeat protein
MESNVKSGFSTKTLTYISYALMLVVMLWASKDFGITGDEVTQNTYGEKVYDYFASMGKDQSALSFKNVYYYGGFYDLLCATVNKVLHADTYNTRHFINAIFGFLVIVAAGAWAKWYKGWGAALLTAWFLFMTPRFFGESMNNPKDIPFALGMTLGAYFICRFFAEFPKPSWKTSIFLALSIAYAIGIRVGGLLLIPFFVVAFVFNYWFAWRKADDFKINSLGPLLVRCVLISVLGYFGGLLFWPYALQAPLSNPLTALGEMSQFSTGIRMLFADEHIMSSDVPWYYIPKWLWITTPLIILMGLIASPQLFFRKDIKFKDTLFLFFAALFPLLYVIYKKSPLYDGWRHMLFIYPALMVIAALSFLALGSYIKHKYAGYIVTAVIVIGLMLPAKWCLANYPNQVVYFNEIVGGIDGAYGYYETDYYMNSVKQAALKLASMADLYHANQKVVIGTNAIEPMQHYMKMINPNIECVYVRYYQRYDKQWDYCILYSRFVDKNILQNNYFPPSNAIATIKADHTPLCTILKKSPSSQDAFRASQLFNNKDYANAAMAYRQALSEDPNNETAYNYLAISLASIGHMDEAIDAINKGLKFNPASIESYDLLSRLYRAKGDNVHAQDAANMVQSLSAKEQHD